jgi:hypothetical protein
MTTGTPRLLQAPHRLLQGTPQAPTGPNALYYPDFWPRPSYFRKYYFNSYYFANFRLFENGPFSNAASLRIESLQNPSTILTYFG